MENEFSHYFVDKKHKEKDFFTFSDFFMGEKYSFNSCSDIFSKDNIDYGTQVLLKTIIKKYQSLGDNALDLCCGYGVIGIILSKYFQLTNFVLSDVNSTCVKLAKENVHNYRFTNILQIIQSSLFENIEQNFDYILTNPPIKSGKQLLQNLATDCYNHLNDGGKFIFVMRKKHGEESYRKYLKSIGFSVEVLEREKGYYIIEATK